MTSKEIIKELYKFVEVFGSIQKREFQVKARGIEEKWVTICKITKKDIEQLERDLDEYELLKRRNKTINKKINYIKSC